MPPVGVFIIIVFGTGVIGAGFFQHDPTNPQAMTTQSHIVASLVSFPSAILGISITSWELTHDDQWPTYRTRSVPLGIAGIAIGLFAIFIIIVMTPLEGFTQRMFLLVLTGWIAYHAYTLRKLNRG